MVFGDQFRHKSHRLLVIGKLLGACGAFNFPFYAAACWSWELPSDVLETDGENIRLEMRGYR